MKEKLVSLLGKVRQYRPYNGTIEKVWNRGMGRLILFKFYPERKIVLANSALYNKADERHLKSAMESVGCDWRIVFLHHGYPDYYNVGFTLHLTE